MTAFAHDKFARRSVGDNVWLSSQPDETANVQALAQLEPQVLQPDILPSEEAVGIAMLSELETVARHKAGDIVMVLLGGRGAQALHRLLGERALRGNDKLLARLHVFTQDALAPLPMKSSLSFVRDFERLLGDSFFKQIKSFTPMQTETDAVESELIKYLDKLESLGGPDIFFLGHGPEPEDASHLAYIRANAGARVNDVAGMIPVADNVLDHHIAKFRAGGTAVSESDEAECRAATHILTLGPALILSARRVVQSVVDAATAPAKRRTFRRVIETKISDDPIIRAQQLDANPGLWVRFHHNFRSLILPDLLS